MIILQVPTKQDRYLVMPQVVMLADVMNLLRSILFFAILSIQASAQVAQVAEPTYASLSLVSQTPLPDPHLHHDGKGWTIFGTNAPPYFFLYGDQLDPTHMAKRNLHLDLGRWKKKIHQIWGAVPYRHSDGSHHLYATLHTGNYRTLIGHFTPESDLTWEPGKPIALWKLTKILLGENQTNPSYYESKIIRDTDGSIYLVYVNRRPTPPRANMIYAQRMLSPDTLDPKHKPVVLLQPDGYRSENRNPDGMQLVEGPSIQRIAKKYVMLYSVGDYTLNNYKLGVAYSDTLIPVKGKTYSKPLSTDTKDLWENGTKLRQEVHYLLQSQKPLWPNYCGKHVTGPGLGSIHRVDGHHCLVFHGYQPGKEPSHKHNPNLRYVYKTKLRINIADDKPMRNWIQVQ